MKHEQLRGDADLGYLLNKATRRLRLDLADALSGTGLTPQQAAVLIALARSEQGRLTPRGIAESIDTDQATTTGLLDRLQRDEWLVSEPNPDDGRSRLITLSPKAKEALPSVLRAADAVTLKATACLSPEEVQTLSVILAKVCTGNVPAPTKDQKGGSR